MYVCVTMPKNNKTRDNGEMCVAFGLRDFLTCRLLLLIYDMNCIMRDARPSKWESERASHLFYIIIIISPNNRLLLFFFILFPFFRGDLLNRRFWITYEICIGFAICYNICLSIRRITPKYKYIYEFAPWRNVCFKPEFTISIVGHQEWLYIFLFFYYYYKCITIKLRKKVDTSYIDFNICCCIRVKF